MFKIALDAGHGLPKSGKRCLKSIDKNETREWTLNSRVATMVENKLKDYEDVQVIRLDDVTGKTDVKKEDRVKNANKEKVDIYFSIHHNAGIDGGSGGGVSIFRCPGSTKVTEELLKKAYDYIIAENKLKGNRSNPVTEKGLYVLRHTEMPAILLENGFMDSIIDTPIILTQEHAEKTAQGIVNFLADYGKLKKKVVVHSSTKGTIHRVQLGAFAKKANAENLLKQVKAKGFDGYVKKVLLLYKVQVGAYSKKDNATAMLDKLTKAGFKGYITK